MRLLVSLGMTAVLATTVLAQQPAMPPAGKPIPLAGGPRTHKPEPTSVAIDVRDLMTRSYIIADDSMEGRDTGKPGGARAANYIAAELRRLGLQPAGDNGTFFQNVPFVTRRVDSTGVLEVGSRAFRQYADFLVVPRIGIQRVLGGMPFGGQFRTSGAASVFGGRIGDAATLDPAAAKGKVVVFTTAASGNTRWQFWRGDNLQRYEGAAAIVVDVGDTLPLAQNFRNYNGLHYADTTALALPVVIATSAVTQSLFGAPDPAPGAAGAEVGGHFGFVETAMPAPTRNVVGILPGTDAELRKQYVAVGAHADHVGMTSNNPVDHDSIRVFNAIARPRGADDPPPRNVSAEQWSQINHMLDSIRKIRPPRLDSIFNGADDDGSGTVLALEIAEALSPTRNRPKRSVLFVFHAAEERGLYGAQYYSEHPTVPRDSIVAQINMDQMGRGGAEDAPPSGTDAMIILGVRRLSSELGATAEAVNKRPAYGFKIDQSWDQPNDPSQGWCRSDHYMYARYGMPVLFFVSAVWYIDYHMVSDEPQYLDYPRMAKVGNYIRDVVTEVANQAKRPVVDGVKPADPHGVCRQ